VDWQALTSIDQTRVIFGIRIYHVPGKPILASWMGSQKVAEGERILRETRIPAFRYPDSAAQAFCAMW
jgi:acyl-CoA synthetase (NDP forming)